MNPSEIEKLADEYVATWLPWVWRELSLSYREVILFRAAVLEKVKARLADKPDLSEAEKDMVLSHFK